MCVYISQNSYQQCRLTVKPELGSFGTGVIMTPVSQRGKWTETWVLSSRIHCVIANPDRLFRKQAGVETRLLKPSNTFFLVRYLHLSIIFV